MANEFYTPGGNPSQGSQLQSAPIRTEFSSIQAGFDKLPTMTGNGSELVRVNAAETALEAVAISEIMASPGAIGGTTPAAGAFTTVSASGLISANGGQVKFPAAQNASADANTLDDYEESTWTPVLTFATPGDLAVAYAIRIGTYTKIGNKVFCNLYVQLNSFTHTTAAGQLRITGLPFNAGSGSYNCIAAWNGITKAGYSSIGAVTSAGSDILSINAFGSGVAFATVTAADCPTGGGMLLAGQIIYIV